MIILTGRAEHVSTEFIRAWAWASIAVLSFHNYPLDEPVEIVVKSLKGRKNNLTGGGTAGVCNRRKRLIQLCSYNSRECMATTILHEFIHLLCGDFGDDTDEKCTSTLTAKFKSDVKVLADQLLDGTYRRAAYIAHTKLSYRSDSDFYDGAQHDPVGAKDKYKQQGGS